MRVKFSKRAVETDVLVIGGGIAGLMAAISAAGGGAKVTIAEKGNILYSGSGGLGNDHFMCYIPEVHGPDIEPVIADFQRGQQGGLRPRIFIETWMRRSYEIVKLWDAWGIPMKYNGQYEFAGHGFPGDILIHLHYAGKNQKKVMTREAKKRGVEILNRTMCFDLLHADGAVRGAIGVDAQQDEAIVMRARAVILSTGSVMRLFPASTPGKMFNTRLSPTCVGDGRAMAYRAGAELASMEIPIIRCGPKYMAKAGKATWAGVLRDPFGKPVGPFVDRPNNKYGDPVVDVYQDIFIDFHKTGKGPIYMDCNGLTDKELEYMLYWLRHEANTPLLNHLAEEGIDVRKTPIEFTTYEHELFPRGGVLYNERAETSMPGLYAAGDEFFGGISGAAVFGWIAGENAAAYVKPRNKTDKKKSVDEQVTRGLMLFSALRSREEGPDWQEANTLLQQIMWDYGGLVRSETLLKAGLHGIRRLKQKAQAEMVAKNQHELTRALEVLNLIDLGEITLLAALERKETRGKHIRVDYPFANPLLEKLLVVKRRDLGPVLEWRKIQRG